MVVKGMIQDLQSDEPMPSGMFDIFKRGKIQCRIYYEDKSYTDFYKKFNKTYTITIKGRDYFVIPNCIIRGKKPSICWFFNNPMPINYDYQGSKLSALDLVEKAKKDDMSDKEIQVLANVKVDAEGMNSLFNTRLMQGLYATGGLSVKSMIIILVVLGVVILVILQATGVVDVQGMISG